MLYDLTSDVKYFKPGNHTNRALEAIKAFQEVLENEPI